VPQPGHVGAAEALGQAHVRLRSQEPRGRRHAWQGPGGGQHRGQQAGGGKAGIFGGGVALLEHGDLMAVARQFVCGGDADDAGAHDGNLH